MDISLIVILLTPIFILLYAIYVVIHELYLRRKAKNEFVIVDPVPDMEEELRRLKEKIF